MNKIVLVGRATRDPESSFSQSGAQKVKFTLAVDRGFKDQSGQKQVDFIDCAAWRNLAATCEKYLRKGLLVAVAGRLEIRPYESQDGQKKKSVEVIADEVRFLEWAKDGQAEASDDDSPF